MTVIARLFGWLRWPGHINDLVKIITRLPTLGIAPIDFDLERQPDGWSATLMEVMFISK